MLHEKPRAIWPTRSRPKPSPPRANVLSTWKVPEDCSAGEPAQMQIAIDKETSFERNDIVNSLTAANSEDPDARPVLPPDAEGKLKSRAAGVN